MPNIWAFCGGNKPSARCVGVKFRTPGSSGVCQVLNLAYHSIPASSVKSSGSALQCLLDHLVTSGDRQLGLFCSYKVIYLSQIWNYRLYALRKAIILAEGSCIWSLFCTFLDLSQNKGVHMFLIQCQSQEKVFSVNYVFVSVFCIEAVHGGILFLFSWLFYLA